MANRPRKVKPDDPIVIDDHNDLVDLICESRIEHVALPLKMDRGPAGTLLGFAGVLLESTFAKSGGSGIPALSGSNPGSATVTLYNFDGTTLTAGDTATAYNPSTTAVGANKWLVLLKVAGYWVVIVESC